MNETVQTPKVKKVKVKKWPELCSGELAKCSEEYTNTLCIRETGQNINNNNLFTLVFPFELLL